MGINTDDIGAMMLHIQDSMTEHNQDLKQWIEAALYRYVTGTITLHEVGLLDRIHNLNVQDRYQRYGIYALIETARHKGYLD